MLQKIKRKLNGVTPFLSANKEIISDPLHPVGKEYKKLNSGTHKSEDTYRKIGELQWLNQWYLNENNIPIVPSKCVKGMMVEAGKPFRLGSKIKACIIFYDNILFNGDKNLSNWADLQTDPNYRVREMAVNRSGASVYTVFPVYPKVFPWSITINLLFENSMISERQIDDVLTYAGRFVSIGTRRPDYGKFDVLGTPKKYASSAKDKKK